MKKFIQYLLGFGLAFLVFASIIVSENTRFDLLQKVKNPFLESKNLTKELTISSTEKEQEIFTKDGELWIFYPNSKTDFSNKNREVIQGEVFLSSYFINYASYLPTQEEGFSIKNFPLVPGWLKVGPLILNTSDSNLLVSRDNIKSWTDIYVFGHSVEVFFDGANRPFVIPANMKVTVRENLINEKTRVLFYSKLKKDLQMAPFTISSTEVDSLENKLSQSLKKLDIWKEKITKFALTEPETWIRSHQDNFATRLIEGVESIQNNFAIGLDPVIKEKRGFRKLVKPLVKTHFFIKNRKTTLAKNSLAEFETSMKSSAWKKSFDQNTEIKNKWENFIQAHKAWLKMILPGSAEELLVDFWFEQNSQNSFDKIIKTFSDAENLFSNRYFRKAKNEFLRLNDYLKNISLTPEQTFQITKMRRLFVEIIKREEFFQDEEMFKLHRFLIDLELENHTEQELLDEIRLESSQDLLWFLNTFLEDKTKIEVSKVMLRTYKMLEVNKVMERLGRDIFTPEESELIKLVTLIGNTGLSKEELDAIKEAKEYQEELNDRITEIQQQNDSTEGSSETSQIINAKYLKNFLTEKGIDTSEMNFQTNREEGTTSFSKGKWHGHLVSGTFDFTTQFFKSIQVGNESQNQINLRFLEGFLNKIPEENKIFPEKIEEDVAVISQTTSRSILERKLVQELFILKGFSISRDKVEIINREMTTFHIKEASFDHKFKLDFVYDRSTDSVTNITTKAGKTNVDFGSRTIPLEDLSNVLQEELEALLSKKRIDE
ncbi:hypothetical protein K9M41_02385 [Candidatus Gracilibacteria bacterium]|nr:hypothetical protein [Candidatus Gracilibacteria bacterium]